MTEPAQPPPSPGPRAELLYYFCRLQMPGISLPDDLRATTSLSEAVDGVALVVMAISFGAPWIAVVALKGIAAEVGGARSIPALAGSLACFAILGRLVQRETGKTSRSA